MSLRSGGVSRQAAAQGQFQHCSHMWRQLRLSRRRATRLQSIRQATSSRAWAALAPPRLTPAWPILPLDVSLSRVYGELYATTNLSPAKDPQSSGSSTKRREGRPIRPSASRTSSGPPLTSSTAKITTCAIPGYLYPGSRTPPQCFSSSISGVGPLHGPLTRCFPTWSSLGLCWYTPSTWSIFARRQPSRGTISHHGSRSGVQEACCARD